MNATEAQEWARTRVRAEAIRRRRLALGMTQRQLARALAVGLRTLVRWETGTQAIPRPAMIDLALRELEARR